MFIHPLKKNANTKDALQRIQLNLDKQKVLTNHIKSLLPSGLADHCLHVTLSDSKITLYTDSSMWASKLLYLRKSILAQAAKKLEQPVTNFRVKVLANDYFKSSPSKLLKPSTDTLNNMSEGCSTIKDGQLKDSLSRLIRTLKG